MAFTLYSLLQAGLLVVNAIAVLHEERFLRNVGWASDQGIGGFGEEPGIKAQIMNLIRSVRTVMRVPLIAVNSVASGLLPQPQPNERGRTGAGDPPAQPHAHHPQPEPPGLHFVPGASRPVTAHP
ncbi:Immediate early response 3-interacting protein 1 [Aix galericulata]|nr:Immediate early response 3-interacting protein 1 [Aix galericulata]